MATKNILEEIVERRIKDMEKLGWDYGFSIPEKRQRAVHPFLEEKGVILEVKRASPSKGDIAPNLDSAATALSYAKAGAKAVSCLTESNYFKGTLEDLMKVCAAVDSYEAETGKKGPAVLRKDFLIDEKEIEIAYRAGADAVLLISRILPVEKMISMAKKCQELGITALVELRLEEDILKLAEVTKYVDKKYIVSGVNSRDLSNFTIDLLTPCAMLQKIKAILGDDARVIFESGIRTAQSAAFAGSLGFAGLLLGEAAAKNPEIRADLVKAFVGSERNKNADFWNNYATKKEGLHTKICGLTNTEDALKACELGADFLGFIFWNKSPREAHKEAVIETKKLLDQKKIKGKTLVGVIVDPSDEEAQTAIKLVEDGILDVLQLHTMDCARKFLTTTTDSATNNYKKLPHYAAININEEKDVALLDELFDLGEPRVLVDAQTKGKIGGTGKQISSELVTLVQKKYKLWLAGGINPKNVAENIKNYEPELIDCASGVEAEPGKKDVLKLVEFFDNIK
ncbi:MAG: bifunctional indole-3-glycerol phosphate synthase/phosphoribosylanthranilate isomerase [Treponema sp.]|nr:bifunctional indole-3-glycerol phosphate synthase/phosphoribosylanthranilate isomerase [Treponema sp.]